ncbi:MAG: DUF4352 domain-containing protein [Candidatus Promineofilum sp.]|nr:DUF4352 domain-containing protein [Promineifilum sp.]
MSADPQPPTSSPFQRLTANPALLLLAIVAVVALLAACILGFLLLRPRLGGGQTTDGVTAGEPTPFPDATAPAAGDQAVIVGVSDTGTFTVTLDAPATLGVLDQQRLVQPESIGVDGLWNPEISEENAAWVVGTIVNYVFGLPDTEANRALLESLAPGNEMTVTTRGGTVHTFAFDSRSRVPSADRSVFSQLSPGISLILLGGDEADRLVVRGRYEVAAADPSASGNVIQLGETAQLGDAQFTVQANSFLTNRPEAPTGFGFFLIDFVVQNVGLTAIDSSAYRFTLSDELGNQYALNPIASRLGNFPPLGGFVNAGQSVSATAGYQIPAGLVSPNLTWTVTGPDGTEIQAVLAFTAGGDAGQSAVISLQEATITPDLNNLIIVGQVTNVGAQPLVIAPEDISLRTPTGSDYLLLATNPPFPWTVPPNQTLQFAVTYQRPIGSPSAVFTLLSQPFELSGLQ